MRNQRYLSLTVMAFGLGTLLLAPAAGLSQKGKNQREIGRSEYFKKWLQEDVVYIISAEEKKVFSDLTTDEEREKFIEQFWHRRDSDPRTPDNEFKEEHYRRIAYANERFASGVPGWKTDRGRIYIAFGEPAQIESYPSGGSYNREFHEGGGFTSVYPFERWRYRWIEGVGDDIEIEFVDRSMSGEYRIALSPDEKDALLHVPGAGLTLREEMGLSSKADRPYFNPSGGEDPSVGGYMRAKDMPFERMERYFNLQRPPQIKFDDLKSIVTTKVTYNQLPYNLRTDFIRLSPQKVLVPITIELENKNLEFKRELDFNRAVVNVYGLVTALTGRYIEDFDHEISMEYTDQFFAQGKQNRAIYQKIVALPPGQRFKLDLALKDVNSGKTGVLSLGINVPKYSADGLQSSSIILANDVKAVTSHASQLEQFVIGDLKVLPNVKSEYGSSDTLIPYVQFYNASVDQTTLEPSLSITYAIKSNGKSLQEIEDTAGQSVQFFSGQRVVALARIPLKELPAGEYQLEIKVLDRITGETLVTAANFKMN